MISSWATSPRLGALSRGSWAEALALLDVRLGGGGAVAIPLTYIEAVAVAR